MRGDRRACGRWQVDAQRNESCVERGPVRGRQLGEVIDARRERFSVAGQAPLLWSCPALTTGPAPGVVVCASLSIRSSAARLVRGRVSPSP